LDAIGISLLRQAAVEVVRETVRTPDPVGQACQTVDRIISIANGAGKSGKLSTAAGQVIDIADRTVRLLYRQRPVHGIEGRLHRADGILEGGDVTDRVVGPVDRAGSSQIESGAAVRGVVSRSQDLTPAIGDGGDT